MTDPRNFVECSPLSCERERGRYHVHGAWADWPKVVAFAEAILAANQEWLDSQTPTIEELRARYLGYPFAFTVEMSGSTDCYLVVIDGDPERFINKGDALRWLAAKLEELEAKR